MNYARCVSKSANADRNRIKLCILVDVRIDLHTPPESRSPSKVGKEAMLRYEPDGADAQTIDAFCSRNGISRAMFYKLQKQGLGPKTMRLGSRVLITSKSAEKWRAQMEGYSR